MNDAVGNPALLQKFCKKINIPFQETAGKNYLSYWVREHIRLTTQNNINEPMDTEPIREECYLSVTSFNSQIG